MYRACIFDLDGTLTNTLDSLTYSVNAAMRELGMPEITREQCRLFVGNGSRVLLEKTLAAGGDEKLEKLPAAMEAYGRIFDENCTYRVTPYEGVPQMIEELKLKGLRLAVLSNKPDRQAVHVVEEIFGKGKFDLIRGQREGVPRKPDPTAALAIASALGVTPGETLYIGDSEVDAATGKAAGMRTVLVSWGFRSMDVLKAAGVKDIVDSARDIVRIAEGEKE
ncbi:HAD family hydrolase [Lachnoclostridium sp. An169]|mgnify:FL=1|uniref:HAD family hydrolase n=1 Tax=Lachnoclostridium sp. An169 TaxID=1965569 RepID=UPI000B3768EB|nr:HAD family hydrolase [Lachnoclostridium sp. An169]OUP86566.1 HAD family hydrolase [Lachnoclostridium sp. An169]HJA65177.1 HAD family hydrolase [Candidatus Mediterraneibacter cottocaccae]